MSTSDGTADAAYEWLSPRDAVLRRPDTHVGAVALRTVRRTVLDEDGRPHQVVVDASPALEKLFDELLTNALDARERDAKVTEIRVEFGDDGSVCVANNCSDAIPTGLWGATDRHVPEVLFTELNAGSNLSYDNAHNVGGRNGVGATVCNIFSKEFRLEIANPAEGVLYRQTMRDNGAVVEPPTLTKHRAAKGRVKVWMLPDYERLGMPSDCMRRSSEGGVRALLVGRAVDAAACTQAAVFVNERKVAVSSLKAYALAHGGTLLGQDRSVGAAQSVSGLQWQAVAGDEDGPPAQAAAAREDDRRAVVHNAALQRALVETRRFSRETWDSFGVQGLAADSVVRGDDGVLYRPVAKAEAHVQVLCTTNVAGATATSKTREDDERDEVVVPDGEEEDGLPTTTASSSSPPPAPAVQVCFVNGVRCVGKLLDAVVHQLCAGLTKANGVPEKAAAAILCEHVSVFVVARMNMPQFGSQSKDVLDTPVAKFGFDVPTCALLCNRVASLPAVRAHVQLRRDVVEAKAGRQVLKKKGSKLTKDIKKYERATEVGKGKQCTLWIPEGDSAKAMIVQGFSVIGRRYHGVYPLRGKIMNVQNGSLTDALKNAEVRDLFAILQLDASKTYDAAAVRRLPYRLMVTTDQDDDGSHIFGLVMTIFYRFFPSILRACPGFVQRFVTPVVKVRKGGVPTATTPIEFFSNAAYKQWARTHAVAGHKVAYYKGLGTHTDEDAEHYFSHVRTYTKTAMHSDESAQLMRTAFGKDQVGARRDLIRELFATDAEAPRDDNVYRDETFSVCTFVRTELAQFWVADNLRSLPAMLDGLKPSQRKVLYTMLKSEPTLGRGAKGSGGGGGGPQRHKVAQLAGEVAKATDYHHGEQSLADVATRMAQSFQGANNVPLLQPLGQFGNRHGEKPSQPRYLFTALARYTRYLFRPEDDAVLTYLEEDGVKVEPQFYVPVVPMLLVNGADGIGTAYASVVPAHAVGDVVAACRALCVQIPHEKWDDAAAVAERVPVLTPHVAGFQGTTHRKSDREVQLVGVWEWSDDRTLRITELPPGVKTNALKEALLEQDCVDDVVSHCAGSVLDLRVSFHKVPPNWQKMCRLQSTVGLGNMNAFDASGVLRAYESALAILTSHAKHRRALYLVRKEHVLRELRKKLEAQERRLQFVRDVVSGAVAVVGAQRTALRASLGVHARELLAIPLDDMTDEGIAEHEARVQSTRDALRAETEKTPEGSWLAELDELETALRADGRWCTTTTATPASTTLPAPTDANGDDARAVDDVATAAPSSSFSNAGTSTTAKKSSSAQKRPRDA